MSNVLRHTICRLCCYTTCIECAVAHYSPHVPRHTIRRLCCDTPFGECAATHHMSIVLRHTLPRKCRDKLFVECAATPYVGCAAALCVDCAVAHLFITTNFRILDLQVGTGKIHWNSRFIHSIEGHTFLSTALDTRKSLYCNFLLLLLTYVFAVFFFAVGALSNAQVIDNSGLRGCLGWSCI